MLSKICGFFKKKVVAKINISEGLENKSITIDRKGHATNSISRQLKDDNDMSLSWHKIYCFNCDKYLGLVLNDDVLSFREECIAKPITEAGKLVSTINLPTGEIVFQNCFQVDRLYEDPNNKWGPPSINSLIGRKALMDYLATQNVGYGQMGNMAVAIYSNLKDEILVADSSMEELIGNVEDVEESPDLWSEEEAKQVMEDGKYAKPFRDYIKSRNMKFLGKISLSVWRWMCADKSVLEEAGEKIKSNEGRSYKEAVIFNVDKGDWVIEHYFDFAYEGMDNSIYSKIKLKNENEVIKYDTEAL